MTLRPLSHLTGVNPSPKYIYDLNDINLAFARKDYLKEISWNWSINLEKQLWEAIHKCSSFINWQKSEIVTDSYTKQGSW